MFRIQIGILVDLMILLMCYKIAGHKNDVHVGLVFTRLQKECHRVKLSSSMLSVLHFALRATCTHTVHNVSHVSHVNMLRHVLYLPLRLYENNIGDEGTIAVSEVLRKCGNLQHLE